MPGMGPDSGNSIANGGVVSRSPALSLITRKFARQSHAGFSESRNAVFCRLLRAAHVGSIPIARSTLRLRQTTPDNSPKPKSMAAWEGLGIRRRFPARFVVSDCLSLSEHSHA